MSLTKEGSVRYSVKGLQTEDVQEAMEMISRVNEVAHANKRNCSVKYDHQAVIDFLKEDSTECDDIISSFMPPLSR